MRLVGGDQLGRAHRHLAVVADENGVRFLFLAVQRLAENVRARHDMAPVQHREPGTLQVGARAAGGVEGAHADHAGLHQQQGVGDVRAER